MFKRALNGIQFMNISIVGTGYVGTVTGACLAELGNKVFLVDVIKEKVDKINKGIPPIYEEGLEELLKRNRERITATLDLKEAVTNSDVTFITVGTPSNPDGSIDLKCIKESAEKIGAALKEKERHVVVVKSTVVPGTTENVVVPALEKASGKKAGKGFGAVMNPEFLREGKAIKDFMKPDRIVIGGLDEKSLDSVVKLYKGFSVPILRTNLRTAEMIKYAANAFLAAKISLINEIGNICKKLGIDTYEVAEGIGHDKRIGRAFLDSGAGFGGSCFPKDVKALIAKAKELGYEPKIMEEVLEVNKKQPLKMVELVKKRLPKLEGKTIAVLGLAFKAGTDDVRESPAIPVIKSVLKEGVKVKVYDPEAMKNMKKIFQDIEYCKNLGECLKGSDACLILTDWEEFKNLGDSDFSGMRNKIIIEGRKVLDKKKNGDFEGITW